MRRLVILVALILAVAAVPTAALGEGTVTDTDTEIGHVVCHGQGNAVVVSQAVRSSTTATGTSHGDDMGVEWRIRGVWIDSGFNFSTDWANNNEWQNTLNTTASAKHISGIRARVTISESQAADPGTDHVVFAWCLNDGWPGFP